MGNVLSLTMKDITELLRGTACTFVSKVITSGGVVLGEKFSGFYGYFLKNKKAATALATKIKKETGAGGFISTDELPAFGITEAEKKQIEEAFGVAEGDVVIFVVDKKEKAEKALSIVEIGVKALMSL
jgi:Glu-tRNA(Gln) amidotransferase subunit E-like FAD-binding protein